MVILYCGWIFLLIIRGYNDLSNFDFLKGFLFDPNYGGMFYFVPLILFFPSQTIFYKRVFDIIFLFGIFYFLFDIIFIKALLSSGNSNQDSLGIVELSSDLSFPCGFILLTYKYHSNKRVVLAAAAMLVSLLFAIIRARRGLIIMTSSIILFAYLIYFFTSKHKLLTLYLSFFVVIIGIIYMVHLYKPEKNPIFSFILERGDEDTRTGVELYFYDDMKGKDWLIGRGINGEYFCPDMEPNQITNFRHVIETGYLQAILKGGVLYFGLILLITIPAIIKGLFFSKNLLSKGAAVWIFLALISLYPATVITFSLRYLLVWISVGICYSKSIRNLPDNKIKELLSLDKQSLLT
jgi:hypothetical protein